MSAPLSVIIPTLNSAQTLGPCLGSLSEALGEGLLAEVIFADGGSSDDTVVIAEEIGAQLLPSSRGRGTQMAAGAGIARGEWLLFLHSDSVLQAGWQGVVRAHMRQEKAGYFRLAFDDASLPALIVSSWGNIRARLFGLPYGDQGLLISRELYNEVGGFCHIPLMEDVAMAKALHGRLAPLPASIVTSADKYRAQGWARRSVKNGWLLLRYKLGVSPTKLAREYS